MTEDAALQARRDEMVEDLRRRGITDTRVLSAMSRIPREAFVRSSDRARSYGDHALPIDSQQTISQPYMVAVMTQLLQLQSTDNVLEIGTGSGYQTAILAELAQHVVTVERISALSESAKVRLDQMGYGNIEFHVANGAEDFGTNQSFDAVIITAASDVIPDYIVDVMKEGGRIVAPIGPRVQQQLLSGQKTAGKLKTAAHFGCRFVPLLNESPQER